jgi:hypothetical protein
LYRHDLCWEDGGDSKPTDSGIAGSGVHAAMTLILEGDGTLKVSGMTMCSLNAGCGCPYGTPVHDAICNSWYQAVDWPEFEWGSIQLSLHDLPAGAYTLYSYHNHFGCYRLPETDDGTPVNCDCTCNPAPAMPIIRAMSVREARYLPYQNQDPFTKLFPGVDWDTGPFSQGVVSVQDAYDVPVQQVTSDDELVPSVIRFKTDGSPVLILYKAGCCEPDPVRPTRVGGRGILNAFRLVPEGQAEPATAYDPSPADGSEGARADTVLSWRPGKHSAGHDLYFGADFDDVNGADISSERYKGRQSLDANSYALPGLLEPGRPYYWRIDEVNEAHPDSPWKGPVWTFMVPTAEYFVLDDMESYNTTDNKIYDTWRDGFANLSGSWIELGLRPDPSNDGVQSMEYQYNNSYDWGAGYYSESERSIGEPNDWMGLGARVLRLYFHGAPDNDANATERMYAALEDGLGRVAVLPYEGDMSDVKTADWQQWDIELRDFTGVDLTDVNKVYVGFGDRDNAAAPGGSGMVYFDDLRLYPPKCVAEYGPAADLSGDCVVDYKDLKIMAGQWLDTGGVAADLYEDDTVDFTDYAVLADGWLDAELWPPEQ